MTFKKRTFIIAEAGVNHNGKLALAKRLVEAAAESGADVIKFQTFKAKNIITKSAHKAAYQKSTTPATETQFEMIKKLELNKQDHIDLISYCYEKNIKFLSSPFDLASLKLLLDLGLDIIKIPSGEITNLPFLKAVGKRKKQIILSSGMATMQEITEALSVLRDAGTPKESVTILHCNTEYPTPFEDVNLKAMNTIYETLGVKVGYSDHTVGIEVPVAAVALGATVIEKHFTLSRDMEGPDHKASLEPDELKKMVESIRNIEICLGDGIKRPSNSEIKNLTVVRKSIVAAKKIEKGELFCEKNLTVKRPGHGISPMRWDEVIGQKATKEYFEDDLIED